MNYQTNINDASMNEEESLQNEIEEVKKLASFRKEKNTDIIKKGSIQNVYAMISGAILMVVGFVFFIMNGNVFEKTTAMLIVSGITFALGIICLVFGTIFFFKEKKDVKKKKKAEVIIVPKDQFVYNKELEKKTNDYIVKVKAKTALNSAVKEKKFVSPLADLEDEAEAVGANKMKVVKNYDFFDITNEKVLTRFEQANRCHNVNVQKKDSITFLSHLFYSRFLIVKGINKFCRRNFSLALEQTFQSRSFYIDCNNIHSEDQLISQPFFDRAFQAAQGKKDDFVFIFLDGVNSMEIYSLFKDFLAAIFDKNNPHKVRTQYADKQYEMLPNIYFIVMLKNQEDAGLYASNDILTYAPIINLECTVYAGDIVELDDKKISISDFHHINDELKGEYYLEESNWKKFDALQNFVNSIKAYQISNDITNDIEQQVAFNYSLSHDVDSVMDDVLSIDLLPGIVTYLPKEKVFGEDSLEMYLSDHFSSEFSLPKTEALLKNYSYSTTHTIKEEQPSFETVVDTPFSTPIEATPATLIEPEVVSQPVQNPVPVIQQETIVEPVQTSTTESTPVVSQENNAGQTKEVATKTLEEEGLDAFSKMIDDDGSQPLYWEEDDDK